MLKQNKQIYIYYILESSQKSNTRDTRERGDIILVVQ